MPGPIPIAAIYLAWLVWVVSWILAAVWSSKAQSRPGLESEATYRALTVVGVVLLFFTASHAPGSSGWPRRVIVPLPPALTAPLWILPGAAAWACVALTVAGFAFAWWARIHLGRLWSGSITRSRMKLAAESKAVTPGCARSALKSRVRSARITAACCCQGAGGSSTAR